MPLCVKESFVHLLRPEEVLRIRKSVPSNSGSKESGDGFMQISVSVFTHFCANLSVEVVW